MKCAPLACACLALISCAPAPDFYKIPPQHRPSELGAGPGFKSFVPVDDLEAEVYYLKDIQGLEGDFRWTHAEPLFRFFLKSVEKQRLRVEFSVHDVTFKVTGPVTMVFLVNGNELARVRYTTPGRKTFDKPVPPEWLKTVAENRVSIQVLNPYPAGDGVRLGFLLYAAGFVQK